MEKFGGQPRPDGVEGSNYLNRIMSENAVIPPEDMQEVIFRLNQPLLKENGEPYVHTDFINFAEIDEGSNDEINIGYHVSTLRDRVEFDDAEYPDYVLQMENWKKLDKLKIASPNTDQEIEVSQIAPEGYDIYMVEGDEFVTAQVNMTDKAIYLLGGNITAAITIIALLHEIGHGWDHENVKQGTAQVLDSGENADIAETLRKERVATAFALKAVRAVTQKDSPLRKDAVTFLKHHALHSYNLSAQDKIAQRERMAMIARELAKDYIDDNSEMEERAKWDEYEAWKETDEYLDWKQTNEYRDIDPDLEYGIWQSWCEANGRAWWRVIPEI